MPDKRPNILFAFADDWGRYASAYRQIEGDNTPNALLDTPNFDRVAREGALFTNAFVPAPSCTPCRSSLLTGRYFWQTGRGAILQGAVWDSAIPSYPLLLEEAGYHIGYTYKVWSPGTPRDAPYGGDRTRYAPAGTKFGEFSFVVTENVPEHGVEGAKQILYDESRQNFDAFLEARPPDTPFFCYWWGPTNTHRKWQRGSGKALWGLEPDDLKGRLPAFSAGRARRARGLSATTWVNVSLWMPGSACFWTALEELGELDNTLVVVSGDHGIPGFPRGKCNLYNLGCEVALAARWPGGIPAGRTLKRLCEPHGFSANLHGSRWTRTPQRHDRSESAQCANLITRRGRWTQNGRSLLPVESGTSARHERTICLTHNVPSARKISCTSATSLPIVGPWAIRKVWTTPPRSLHRSTTCAMTQESSIPTWMPVQRRRG